MTNKEMFKAAIEKALKDGWSFPEQAEVEKWAVIGEWPTSYLSVFYWHRDHNLMDGDHTYERKYSINDIIFNHNFAKALFGDGDYYQTHDGRWMRDHPKDSHTHLKGWQLNLQRMALEEDALNYIGRFLDYLSDKIPA